MRLQHPFYRFPFRFDAARMRAEIDAIPEECWYWHHENFKGNSALHLITTDGGINDAFAAPMRPTEYLKRMPYVMQVMGEFKTLMGRARLMRLEPGDGVPIHCDTQYYWRTHTRVHIPVITNPEIRFHCGGEHVHMAEGEAWTFDNWRLHKVVNETGTRRIHLTFDTLGSADFWALARPWNAPGPEHAVPYREGFTPNLSFESYAAGPVMSPAELELELTRYLGDVAANPNNDRALVNRLSQMLHALRDDWRVLWHAAPEGGHDVAAFRTLVQLAGQRASEIRPAQMTMASNGCSAGEVLRSIFSALVTVKTVHVVPPRYDRPVFIVCAPRSGSTLLFETLAASTAFWTVGGEGHGHIEQINLLKPRNRGMDSNRLTAADATNTIADQLRANYAADLRDAEGRMFRDTNPRPDAVRFLEKTPKNALRIPFLKRVFPDAKFIFLHRDARANISAIIEAWRSGGFVTYPDLPGWTGPMWSLLLIPGWRELIGADIAKIAMRQWRDTNETILADLSEMPSFDWCDVRYEDLVSDPVATIARLCNFADVPFDARLRGVTSVPLPPSRYTITAPDPDKWRANASAMAPYLDEARMTAATLVRLPGARIPEPAQ